MGAHPLPVIVLDFDGVILESVGIKGAAFRALFAQYPQHQDRIEQFHYDNSGMSRYEKFAWIYRDLLRRPLTAETVAVLDRQFGDAVASALRTCPFVAGAREFIERRATDGYRLCIASGTPEPELRVIVNDRGLTPFFSAVYGAPRTKAALLQTIADESDVPVDALLFIGDGRQDCEAAMEVGASFIARRLPTNADFFARSTPAVADLFELMERWPALSAARV